MKNAAWLMCVSVVAVAGSCKENSEPLTLANKGEAKEHHDEEGHGALPKQLSVSLKIAKEADLKSMVAKRGVLAMTIGLPGEITASPDCTAKLSAATSGKLEQVSFNEGSVVKKGDVLAWLRVPDVGRLRGALAATSAKARASRANAERLRALKESGLGAEQALVDAEADARAQEAEAKAIAEQLGAIGINAASGSGYLVPLRAPIAGVVVSRDAVVGQPIGAEHVLATVVDLSEVWFLGRVFEKDLGRLRPGAKSAVQLNAFPGERFEGVVDYVGQQTDPVVRTLTVRVRLKNTDGRLRLGLFGTAGVEVEEANQASPQIIVPRSAVTDVGGKSIVFVKAADGDFVVHEVTLGDAALAQVQVLSGIDENEEVVVNGVFTLKSLLLKSSLAEDPH
ncbi:MAG: efflux RND transporter periplasmic adaptor subunit [Myxococcaceae bacterium]|nr:efflux RND transporter periplasmic adaptor subunit [Myxococcaceae bacterium]